VRSIITCACGDIFPSRSVTNPSIFPSFYLLINTNLVGKFHSLLVVDSLEPDLRDDVMIYKCLKFGHDVVCHKPCFANIRNYSFDHDLEMLILCLKWMLFALKAFLSFGMAPFKIFGAIIDIFGLYSSKSERGMP
jgi:hypothetical protein